MQSCETAQKNITLDAVLHTEELRRRPARPPNYKAENLALNTLAQALADSPQTILQQFVASLLELFEAGSSGISLMYGTDGKEGDFYWPVVAGPWAPYIGAGTPRNFGPCGVVIDRRAVQLFSHPELYYPYIRALHPPVCEALLAPFFCNGKALGTVWVVTHDEQRKFDAEDQRLITSLSRFAGAAYQTWINHESQNTELNAVRHLHLISTLSLQNSHADALYQTILDGAAAIMSSDFACLQNLCESTGELKLLAQRGFSREAAASWECVRPGSASFSGVALRTAQRVMVQDVRTCDLLAGSADLDIFMKAGIQAVQSTPLFSRSGQILGVISTHWQKPHQPTERDLRLLDVLTRLAADVIDRNRTQEFLRESEQKLRAIFDGTHEYIGLIALDGTLLEANRASLAFANSKLEDVIGRKFWDTVWFQYSPGSPARVREAFFQAVTGEFVRLEAPIVSPAGVTLTFDISFYPIRDESGNVIFIVPEGREITERKRAEDQLRMSEQRVRLAADAAELGFWTWDLAQDSVTWENDRPYEIFGLSRTEAPINGARFKDEFVHPDDASQFEKAVALALKYGRRFYFSGRMRRVNGDIRWVEFTGTPVPGADGAPLRMHGTAADITERKLIEEELRNSDRRKDEFLAVVSHELRTPLTAMVGWIKMLRAKKVPREKVAYALEVIERNVKLQSQLIEDLLDISRIITGKLHLDVQPLDLKAVVQAAIESVRPALEAKKLHLATQLTSVSMPGDSDRLQQVIWNLLANAIKFTPNGGTIEVLLSQVYLRAHILIRDSGCGINAQFLPIIFSRFQQADVGATRNFGGLGLGLSIVRHLVELHGGTIVASSEGEGKGAAFSIELPLPSGGVMITENIELKGSPLRGLNVLVVDDDMDARNLLEFILQSGGASVITASTVVEAIEHFKNMRPDVVISDISMPVEDGYSFIRRIRSYRESDGKKTPALALTAFAREEDRQRVLEAGFDDHLSKPIEPQGLIAMILKIIAARRV